MNALLLALLLDVVNPTSGGGGSLASGTTPATGCQNRIMYGNNANIFSCKATLLFTDASDTLFLNGTYIVGADSGSANNIRLRYAAAQTPDAPVWYLGTTHNSFHIAAIGSDGVDLNNGPGGTSATADPTLILHSNTGSSTTEWGSLARTTTSFQLAAGDSSVTSQRHLELVGKTLALADNTATTIFTMALGNDKQGGGMVRFSVWADDNTNDGRQMTTGTAYFTGVDKTAGAGGEDCDAALVGTNVTSLSPTNGGTVLTVTVAATTGTDLCNFRLTADSDLAVVTSIRIMYDFIYGGNGITITPQ